HAPDRVNHVMMVVPVDRQIDEAQKVAEKDRKQRLNGSPVGAVRNLQLQHHDGDDDGDDAVAERRQSFLRHVRTSSSVPIPKFAIPCGTLSCELRNQRDTSKYMFLVPLLNPKFANPTCGIA